MPKQPKMIVHWRRNHFVSIKGINYENPELIFDAYKHTFRLDLWVEGSGMTKKSSKIGSVGLRVTSGVWVSEK